LKGNSAELRRWLNEGAYFYVCGDSKRMAPDLEAALLEAVATHSNKGHDYANGYLRDVY
jgi:sulfite reductase (NADPH) flavoprotein alpha-component